MSAEPWTPQFEGQRPPFEKGNVAALKHGARSERAIEQGAREVDDDMLRDHPELRNHPLYGGFRRAEAIAKGLFGYVANQLRNGEVPSSAIANWNAAENTAAKRLDEMLLTPRAELQAAKDRAIAASVGLDVVNELVRQGRATRAHNEPDATPSAALRADTRDDLPAPAPADWRDDVAEEAAVPGRATPDPNPDREDTAHDPT